MARRKKQGVSPVVAQLDRTWEFAIRKARRSGSISDLLERLDDERIYVSGFGPYMRRREFAVLWPGALWMAVSDGGPVGFFDVTNRANGYLWALWLSLSGGRPPSGRGEFGVGIDHPGNATTDQERGVKIRLEAERRNGTVRKGMQMYGIGRT